MDHDNFNHIENDKVLTGACGNNLNAANDVLSERNSQIFHQVLKLLRLWANSSCEI